MLGRNQTIFILLTATAVLAAGCMKRSLNGANGGVGGKGTASARTAVTLNGVNGMKPVDNIQAHLTTVTGIPPTNAGVAAAWAKYLSFLPVDRTGTGITTSMTTAFIGITGAYCQGLVTADLAIANGANRLVFKQIDANATMLDANAVSDSMSTLAVRAWSRNPTTVELSLLIQFLNELKSGTTASNAEMRRELVALCTSVLSSIQSLTM